MNINLISNCSVPGKVFIVGGYTVLEENDGLVLETNCRIKTKSQWIVFILIILQKYNGNNNILNIKIFSELFDTPSEYNVDLSSNSRTISVMYFLI